METFDTKFGKITLRSNETHIIKPFRKGGYWDIRKMQKCLKMIDTNRNILEIGGHAGTSTIFYANFIKGDITVYEPQKKMYDLLKLNIHQNKLDNRIKAIHGAMFCCIGTANMNDKSGIRAPLDDNVKSNYGGVSIGEKGEEVNLTTIDTEPLNNIGFIHCDAEGSENFIFSKGINLIKRDRPFILYECNSEFSPACYKKMCRIYPQFSVESKFSIKDYCMDVLNYKECIKWYNDYFLIP